MLFLEEGLETDQSGAGLSRVSPRDVTGVVGMRFSFSIPGQS